jgi:hypothetical protein
MLREDLFYTNYVERILEKEVGSISTINHDKIMIVHEGANHGPWHRNVRKLSPKGMISLNNKI